MLEWVPAGLNTGALSGAKASSSRTRDTRCAKLRTLLSLPFYPLLFIASSIIPSSIPPSWEYSLSIYSFQAFGTSFNLQQPPCEQISRQSRRLMTLPYYEWLFSFFHGMVTANISISGCSMFLIATERLLPDSLLSPPLASALSLT
jgi:hypothetical protein